MAMEHFQVFSWDGFDSSNLELGFQKSSRKDGGDSSSANRHCSSIDGRRGFSASNASLNCDTKGNFSTSQDFYIGTSDQEYDSLVEDFSSISEAESSWYDEGIECKDPSSLTVC
jgi:hypothetical protein